MQPSLPGDLSTFLDGVLDGVIAFDRQWRFTYANSTAARVIGEGKDALQGRVVWDVIPGLRTSPFGEAYVRAMETNTAQSVEAFFPLYNAWFEARAFPNEAGLILFFLDVTARHQAQEQLRLSEQRYRTFVEQSTEGIWRVETVEPIDVTLPADEQVDSMFRVGVLAECNDAMARMYGYPHASELNGAKLSDLLPPDDERNRAYLTAFVENGYRLENAESRERTRDGKEVIFQNTLVGVVEEGRLLRAWGTQRDITAGVLSREQAERLSAALRESERQFRELVENIPELAWSADAEGNINYYNRRWFEYTGTTFGQMEGWGWQAVHDPAVLPDVLEQWRAALVRGEPFEMEFPLRRADGQFRWFLTRVRPLRDSHGKIVRWFGSNTDVDDRRRQAAELQEAVRVRDDFLSVASHELKTPLTPLSLRLESLARELPKQPPGPFTDAVGRYVETARTQLRKLNELVGDLLDVSRITAGKLTLSFEQVDLSALARELAARFEPEATRAGSTLSVHADAEVSGEWDRMRLEQVADNLLSNAVKYGAGRPIEIRVQAHGDQAVLRVKDQGIGIDPAAQPRLFGRFERAVSARNYGGLGLGLYITRTIVDALGGTISLQSALGAGATFEVRLPRTRPADRSEGAPGSTGDR